MLDKNGTEMRTGMIVEISDAYFKNDNGLYFITHSPGDASWWGKDHCCMKLKRNGELSTAKRNLCFWPITNFVSDPVKSAACDAWNREHATIEVIQLENANGVKAYFESELEGLTKQRRRVGWDWGENSSEYERLGFVIEELEETIEFLKK